MPGRGFTPGRTRRTILHVFPTFTVGGTQSRFAAIANHVGGAVRHIVVSLDGQLDARTKLDPELDVTFVARPGGSGLIGGPRAAAAFLRTTPADLLITSNWGSMDWAAANRFLGLPHVHTEDGFGLDEKTRQFRRRMVARAIILRRSLVVLPSRALLSVAADRWHLPKSHLRYIPNGVDLARFIGADPVAIPGSGPVVGTVAVLRPEKNLARLLRAFATVRARVPARLVIVGDGPERDALHALAASLGIEASVQFAGYSANPERWLAGFDVFASSSDAEQMPLSVLEAMAAGLPVAGTNVGDVAAMVSPENAPFVVPRNEGALADALLALLSDPAMARQIGRANATRAMTDFDQAGMFKAWREVWGV
jgi:glycosyltransferase involved in cell wall biosynthesis